LGHLSDKINITDEAVHQKEDELQSNKQLVEENEQKTNGLHS